MKSTKVYNYFRPQWNKIKCGVHRASRIPNSLYQTISERDFVAIIIIY